MSALGTPAPLQVPYSLALAQLAATVNKPTVSKSKKEEQVDKPPKKKRKKAVKKAPKTLTADKFPWS